MISKNSYKFLNVFLYLFILIILNFPHEGHAQIFFSEDWDTGTPPTDWPCKNFPNAITTATFNEWHGRSFLVDNSPFDGGKLSGLSTSTYHSAPRSYYQHRPANDYWTCDITKDIPQPYPTKIHLRFYVYFTNNWLGFDNPPASTYEATHFIFTNTALSGTGFRFNIDDHVSGAYPYECNNDQAFSGMYFEIENGSNAGRRGTAPYDCYNLRNNLNRWQCVEFMVDTANGDGTVDGPYGTKNGRYSQWIDGDLKVNYVSTPVSQANFTKIIISGFSSFLRDFTGDFYIDDIVVSDNYIGCNGGSDTQSPTVPTGLSAQVFSSSQINLSWTAATDNVGVTGYRIYRDGVLINTSATNSYSNTGLSASTIYTYSVSAYDAANNVSAQSVSATATTAADTGGSNQNSGGNDASASGGSGCGFVKDNGKGQKAKGEGLAFAMMLIITLAGITLARRIISLKGFILYKYISVFLTIILVTLLSNNYLNAENTDRTKAESVCSRSDIIICENWEDGDHVDWMDWTDTASWGGPIWGGHSCDNAACRYPYPGYQSHQALLAFLTQDTFGTIYPTHYTPGLGANDTVYARWYVRWSQGFEYNTSNNKNFFIFAGNNDFSFFVRPPRNAQDGVDDPTIARPYIHMYCSQTDAEQDPNYAAECAYSGGDLRYFPNVAGYEGFVMKGGPEFYCVEMMVTPNPVGQSWGGKLKFWIDDILMADYPNVSLRHASDTSPIDRIMLSSYWGGGGVTSLHPDQFVVYDNIVVSKSYIGCNGSGDSGNTPPPSSGSGGDSGGGSSGGGGCGFVKEDGKRQGANGEGLSFILMLIITLCLLPIARRLFKAFNRPVL